MVTVSKWIYWIFGSMLAVITGWQFVLTVQDIVATTRDWRKQSRIRMVPPATPAAPFRPIR